MKTCTECNSDFKPSSRHKRCPACRGRARPRDLCACGNEKYQCYPICKPCALAIRKANVKRGADSPFWMGGRSKNKKGYIRLSRPGHPRGPDIFEHIVVLEEHLGRYLVPGENVHHLNGVRDDNRIENLELWTKPQPSGIRAIDAVEWAKEILARYA